MTRKNGTYITSFDIMNLYDELKVVETKKERDEILEKYGYQGSDGGFNSFKETVCFMERKIERYGELAARIYATGKPLHLCTSAINVAARNDIATTEQIREILEKGYKDVKKELKLRNCGPKVWKVWEEACSLTERA